MKTHVWLLVAAAIGAGAVGFRLGLAPRQPMVASSNLPVSASRTSPMPPAASGLVAPGVSSATAIDAPAQLEAILAYPSDLRRRGELKRYFERLAPAQFSAVLDDLLRSDSPAHTVEMLFRVWAEKAPEEGARHALRLTAGVMRTRAMGAFVRAWGRDDVTAAQKWAEHSLTGGELSTAQQYFAGLARASDSPRSFPAILAMGDRAERQSALRQHFQAQAKVDPAAALAEALKLEVPGDRRAVIDNLLSAWLEKEPLRALRWAQAERKKGSTVATVSEEERAFLKVAAQDVAGAREFLTTVQDVKQHARLADVLAARLVKEDPSTAQALFAEVRAADPAWNCAAFFNAWFEADPAAAAETFREDIARRTAGKSAWGAHTLITAVIAPWVAKDPAAAADFASTLPPETHSTVLFAIAKRWCAADGAAALHWASAQPAGPARDEAMKQFTFIWAQHDTTQSTAWLEKLPADSGRWTATEGFVFSVMDTEPDAALGWARTIPDEARRLDILRRAWGQWSGKNYRSAVDWIENTTLSAEERAAVVRKR